LRANRHVLKKQFWHTQTHMVRSVGGTLMSDSSLQLMLPPERTSPPIDEEAKCLSSVAAKSEDKEQKASSAGGRMRGRDDNQET